MKKINNKILSFLKSEDGPTALEYAVMVALIIVVAIGAIGLLGGSASNTFMAIGKELEPKKEKFK